MSRLLLVVLAFGLGNGLIAADFSGRWAGTVVNAGGQTAPLYLALNQQGEAVSGSLINEPRAVPLSNAVVRNEELRFRVSQNDGQGTDYALTMVVSGNPLSERQVALDGTATSAVGRSTVTLYPVGAILFEQGVVTGPAVVHKVEPVYTEQARAAKIGGTVLLRVQIEETGMVSTDHIQVIRGLGYGLDEAAIECVRQWRFKPAFRSGYAVTTTASIEVNFRPER
ncbi:MAG TPA: energy transducer TonB [Bryobacteraceae bacterium]|nr:energy transducer TonB [Bryobacteraceae bacterium]